MGLHAEGGVGHAAVDFEFCEFVVRVFFHGVEDGFCLEADGFEGGAGDVAALGVVGYADWDDVSLGLERMIGWRKGVEAVYTLYREHRRSSKVRTGR